jgi:hypothetical protein
MDSLDDIFDVFGDDDETADVDWPLITTEHH